MMENIEKIKTAFSLGLKVFFIVLIILLFGPMFLFVFGGEVCLVTFLAFLVLPTFNIVVKEFLNRRHCLIKNPLIFAWGFFMTFTFCIDTFAVIGFIFNVAGNYGKYGHELYRAIFNPFSLVTMTTFYFLIILGVFSIYGKDSSFLRKKQIHMKIGIISAFMVFLFHNLYSPIWQVTSRDINFWP